MGGTQATPAWAHVYCVGVPVLQSIKQELDLETRYAQRRTVSNSTLNRLNDQVDMYTSKVEIERKNKEALQKAVRQMTKKILDKRRTIGGVNAAKEKQGVIHKQIRILENRLDKALVKFNEALAYNKELRRQIDNLRRERFMFDKIYKKLEEELREKKNQMATIIELSNQAYEARDGAQLEIAAIQQSMAKDRAEFEEKMDNFNSIIQQRNRAEQEEADTKRGNMTIQEETELKTEVNMRAWAIAKDRAAMQVSIDKVQSYEEAFKKINVRRSGCCCGCCCGCVWPWLLLLLLARCMTRALRCVAATAGRHWHH